MSDPLYDQMQREAWRDAAVAMVFFLIPFALCAWYAWYVGQGGMWPFIKSNKKAKRCAICFAQHQSQQWLHNQGRGDQGRRPIWRT